MSPKPPHILIAGAGIAGLTAALALLRRGIDVDDAHSVLDLVGVADALVAKGRTLLWGIGHHGPGDNIFSYYIDPNGCVVETSFGMERIDNDALREAGVWDSDYDKRVLDLWGSKPPANYAAQLTPFVE